MSDDPSGWPALFWDAFQRSRNEMALLDERRLIVAVNGAYLRLLGYRREQIVGHPIWELIKDGPLLSPEQWEQRLAEGDFAGTVELLREDGSSVAVQFAAHAELVTGERLVLIVAVSTSRVGRHFRREGGEAEGELSERELEIVHHVAMGSSGPEIAEQLFISHNTVRTHVRNAMRKVGARSQAHLVAKALGDGLVPR
jgi:PAS domain S-box-containing protein